ncbi:Zn-ribbon domain-containing protein [Halorientalis litorea]|jgi:predicted  nucleic acid-binding Zn-ribbon protein|uniref:Zn-ribbon domain-containing protein n=1 Tax=Halorientalis litorea TaxID=2931977 RepID=UPI001FF2DC4B|nr:Zn-ribbon domain-containing protein [Halorientalis litorea]
MPHQCTNCGRAFEDGSKEMLSGCPDCGGNKFQFHPSGTPDEDPDPAAEPPEPPTPDSSVARTVGSAAATVRDLVGSGSTPEDPAPGPTADQETTDTPSAGAPDPTPTPATEDTAQADARSEVVNPDELPGSTNEPTPTDDTAQTASAEDAPRLNASDDAAEDDTDRPDLTDLREELNDQFESIKVLSPGQYELNLMELYDREEYIIALQEDGRYTIQVPERWHDD